MSRSRQRPQSDDIKTKPRVKHRRCESCGEMFEAEDVFVDRDELGRPVGYLCGGCI